MKTKIVLASFAMVVLMVVAVGAGTLAYFTDTETIEGNEFVAGTIDIEVPVIGPDGEPILQTVVTVDGHFDLKPCEVGYLGELVRNIGTNPVHVWKRTVNVVDLGGLNPEPEQTFCGPCDPECSDRLMSTRIHYDLSVMFGPEYSGEWTELIPEDWGFYLNGCDRVAGYWIYLGVLEPEEEMLVKQSYHLDENVGNWAQGDIVEFNMEFMATQTVGNAPAPQPLLID